MEKEMTKELAAQVAEAVRMSLQPDLDRIHNRLDAIENRLDRVEQRLDRVEERLDKVEQQLDKLTEQMNDIAETNAYLVQDVYMLKHKVK